MKHSTQTCGSNDSSWKGTHRARPQSMDGLAPRSRTSATLQMYYQYQQEEKSHREREKKVLLSGLPGRLGGNDCGCFRSG